MEERAELKRLAEAATPGPWCIESEGEKGDGSNMVGVAFAPEDRDCKHQLSGFLRACDDEGEFIDYYRDELVAECAHRNRNSNIDAAYIAAANPSTISRLLSDLEAAEQALNETFVDEHGETWRRPTAEAYQRACATIDRYAANARAAEARASEAVEKCGVLVKNLHFLWTRAIHNKGGTLQQAERGADNLVAGLDLPAAVLAERGRIKQLEANQRTPGMVEVCKHRGERGCHYYMFGGVKPHPCQRDATHCPIRQQVSPPASETGGAT
jgi:hypothetical protein